MASYIYTAGEAAMRRIEEESRQARETQEHVVMSDAQRSLAEVIEEAQRARDAQEATTAIEAAARSAAEAMGWEMNAYLSAGGRAEAERLEEIRQSEAVAQRERLQQRLADVAARARGARGVARSDAQQSLEVVNEEAQRAQAQALDGAMHENMMRDMRNTAADASARARDDLRRAQAQALDGAMREDTRRAMERVAAEIRDFDDAAADVSGANYARQRQWLTGPAATTAEQQGSDDMEVEEQADRETHASGYELRRAHLKVGDIERYVGGGAAGRSAEAAELTRLRVGEAAREGEPAAGLIWPVFDKMEGEEVKVGKSRRGRWAYTRVYLGSSSVRGSVGFVMVREQKGVLSAAVTGGRALDEGGTIIAGHWAEEGVPYPRAMRVALSGSNESIRGAWLRMDDEQRAEVLATMERRKWNFDTTWGTVLGELEAILRRWWPRATEVEIAKARRRWHLWMRPMAMMYVLGEAGANAVCALADRAVEPWVPGGGRELESAGAFIELPSVTMFEAWVQLARRGAVVIPAAEVGGDSSKYLLATIFNGRGFDKCGRRPQGAMERVSGLLMSLSVSLWGVSNFDKVEWGWWGIRVGEKPEAMRHVRRVARAMDTVARSMKSESGERTRYEWLSWGRCLIYDFMARREWILSREKLNEPLTFVQRKTVTGTRKRAGAGNEDETQTSETKSE